MKVERGFRVRAFAPGHVTGIFAPATESRDPRGRGSRGAGLVLELGVYADASHRPGGPRRVRVTSDTGAPVPISTETARRLAPAVGTTTVHLTHQLPVGQGFGTSASGATATALAVAVLAGIARRDAITTAHLADLFGGGGLGGVAAIQGGGLELRRSPGIPPWGKIDHVPVRAPLFVAVAGGAMPSPTLLSDRRALARVTAAASGLDELLRSPTLPRFLEASERFTDRAGFAPRELTRLLAGLRDHGAWAAQAMFGRSLFAVPRNAAGRLAIVEHLREHGVRAIELRPARSGARAGRPQPF
jgi:pantoate kinase